MRRLAATEWPAIHAMGPRGEGVLGLGSGIKGSRFRVQGFMGSRVYGSAFKAKGEKMKADTFFRHLFSFSEFRTCPPCMVKKNKK
jgi:hypothetical protein